MWTVDFWKGVTERATATAAQAGVAAIGTTAALTELDWVTVGSIAGLAAVLSVLKSLAAGAVTGTASVGAVERPATLDATSEQARTLAKTMDAARKVKGQLP